VERRLAAAHGDVVAVEGDVDGAEVRRLVGALLDQSAQALRERYAARVDADERDVVELGVRLDDLVGDPRERPRKRVGVEEDLLGGDSGGAQGAASRFVRAGSVIRLLPGLTGPA
jgi:hypothetical protein